MLEKALKEFEAKSNESYAKGGFLTCDLGDSFRMDVELQKKWLLSFYKQLLESDIKTMEGMLWQKENGWSDLAQGFNNALNSLIDSKKEALNKLKD